MTSVKHKGAKYIKREEAIRKLIPHGFVQSAFNEYLVAGKFPVIAKHPVTGRMSEFIVESIDDETGKVSGHFKDDIQ